MRTLLVEDHPSLAESIRQALVSAGWSVDLMHDGLSARTALETESYALLLLDIGLPEMDGFSLLSWLRKHDTRLPVMIITARGSITERVRGLNLGADDYLIKPFSLSEMEARINALIRRTRHDGHEVHRLGSLAFEVGARSFTLRDRPLTLPPRELALLEALMARLGRTVSKEQLAAQMFSMDEDGSFEAIEVYVHRLRRKLEGSDVRIVTFRGLGYQLERAPDTSPVASS
ncbi:response regulator [Larsenimonas rhizosphaerae]|uniref:response regulator n=1 Tax=Larsenimonas rhizosphaerae TaxID=2944682 RepID=UPI0020346541|nr:response regulator [Larsenimonas rhizosphaerae]MCM2129407.1 response regulator [Larsenimonas rhizosphaerae]